MLLNSIDYLVFFSSITVLYFLSPQRFRGLLLLSASYYFYMCWEAWYALLLIASTASVYAGALLIEKARGHLYKKSALALPLLFNAAMLLAYKYHGFFSGHIGSALSEFNVFQGAPALKLLLPVGISYYTFQAISYLMDVYRGDKGAEKNLLTVALYLAFFPKLLAGPIERAAGLMPQFREEHEFDYQRVVSGLKLIAWGLFKKMVIADRLAVYVDHVYGSPGAFTGFPVVLATVFFTYQIYCDFSGYTDMAIGSGRVLGFRLMNNFDRPYAARSVSEFWRRWHISLSTWLRDYIYDSIVINARAWGLPAIIFSIFVTFLVCGAWHGASWTFIVWGLLHGFALSVEVLTKKGRKKISRVLPPVLYDNLALVLTFSFVCFAHIFFRAGSVPDALLIIGNIFDFGGAGMGAVTVPMSKIDLFIALFSIGILEIVQLARKKGALQQYMLKMNTGYRWALYTAFVGFLLFFRKTGAEFIYSQF